MDRAVPRFVAVIGLHGSASTWLFNVAREQLSAAYGVDAVHAFSTERTAEGLGDPRCIGRHVVWKLHIGDPAWDGLSHLARPIVLVSLRDPRDALLSFMRRFEPSFERAVEVLQRDCRRARSAVESGGLALRYEDGFMADRTAPDRIAQRLGLDLPAEVLDAIFARYATEAVRDFAGRLATLPPGRLAGDPAGDLYDTVTHIHAGHVGEARAGAWRERLSPDQSRYAEAVFAPFLQRFDYPR
ncbi:MAG: hypothetical protein WA840_02315 [Caulobacteraceae bacterium]